MRAPGVPDVVVEVEAVVIDPDRLAEDGCPLQTLPVTGNAVQPGMYEGADPLDVGASLGRGDGAALEDGDRADVHVAPAR